MNPLLMQGRQLKVHFPQFSGVMRQISGSIKAIDGIDFDLFTGEVLGVVGETGSGKTTLGRAALRLVEPTSGSLSFDGEDLLILKGLRLQAFRKKAQMIFQDPISSLNPRKTVGDAIGDGLMYHGLVKNLAMQKEVVALILKLVGLSPDIMHLYPHQFSGGQQQRICIGRAIAMKPKLLICDEVVSALDVSVQAQILNLLQELKTLHTLSYLFISHDLSIVRHLCDRVMVLYLGKVMEVGSVESLFNNPQHPYTQALLSAIPRRHPKDVVKRIVLKGEIPSALNPPSGCPFRTRCPYAQPICSMTPPKKLAYGSLNHEYHCIL